MIDRRARGLLWAQLRLVVIDLETTVDPDRLFYIVSMGAVTCRKGKIASRWAAVRVDPGVPIDAGSTEIHHLTDADMVGAPQIAALAGEIMDLLRAELDEHLVLVAHNVHFDVPILRSELERAGFAMPDLPVIDTMGDLAAFADCSRPSLETLLSALAITNAEPHNAAADAEATAQAVIDLLNRAADAGHDRIEEFYAGRSSTLRFAGPPQIVPKPVTTEHPKPLPARPGKRALATWLDGVAACARSRCDLLADHVADAEVSPLLVTLRSLSDAPAIATLLGAIAPRFADLPHRRAAVALDQAIGPFLDATARCADPDLCPSCQAGEPCPLDVWRLVLARSIRCADSTNQATGFFTISGRRAGLGGYATMHKTHPRLADAALRLVYRYWIEHNQEGRARDLARLALDAGCLDPEIASAHAHALAAGGRQGDLESGLALCVRVLATRAGSTDPAWADLEIERAAISGRLQRLTDRYNASVRRHHPEIPHRTRPPRFLRASIDGFNNPPTFTASPNTEG